MRSAIQEAIRRAYDQWAQGPFPEEGNEVEGYPEYNVYVTGYASQAIAGRTFGMEEVPGLDSAVQEEVMRRIRQGGEGSEALAINHAHLMRLVSLIYDYIAELPQAET